MYRIEKTYNQIIKYLKGLLSNRERHDLEKEMMQDVFDGEAFEGLGSLTSEEMEADMEKLTARLDNRITHKSIRSVNWFYRIAAAIVLLIGISGGMYLLIKKPADKLITQKTKQPVTQNRVSTKSIEAPETEASSMKEKTDKYKIAKRAESEKAFSDEILIHDSLPHIEIASEPEFSYLAEDAEPKFNIVEATEPTSESKKSATVAPAMEANKDEVLRIRGISSIPSPGLFSGKVKDSQGQPLPGVNVQIKGSNIGTVTDVQGNFVLNLQDPNSEIALNFIGYTPIEIKGSELQGKEITMTEDVTALNEVVVVGYGTQKKKDLTSSVYMPEDKIATPPDAYMKKFKTWVESRINYSLFKGLTGDYKIKVIMLIGVDGRVSDIKINDKIPEVISMEYKKVIMESPPWKPAVKDDMPIASEVQITFSLELK